MVEMVMMVNVEDLVPLVQMELLVLLEILVAKDLRESLASQVTPDLMALL